MSNPLRTPDDYELIIYRLPEHFPIIASSTLTFVRLGASLARVSGVIEFAKGFQLVVRERILFRTLPGLIDEYG